jgi:hypothetical protein
MQVAAFRNRLETLFLSEYRTAGFILQQKAYLLLWIQLVLIPVMLAMLATNLYRNNLPELLSIILIDLALIAFMGIGLVLLSKGRYDAAVKMLIICITGITIIGSLLRYSVVVRTGFNYFVAEMFGIMIFTSMFGTRRQLGMVAGLMFATNLLVHFLAKPHVQPAFMIYLDSNLFNTNLMLIIVFWLAYLNGLITDRALAITQSELTKNIELNRDLEQKVAERTRELEQTIQQRQELIGELQLSLAKVKTLSGFLPICASCKKIRDDQGYWNQIETYISSHSDAEFSHSLCPECFRKLYPGFEP